MCKFVGDCLGQLLQPRVEVLDISFKTERNMGSFESHIDNGRKTQDWGVTLCTWFTLTISEKVNSTER